MINRHEAPSFSAAAGDLLFERFRSLTAEEILSMITHLTPLEETRAYQDIFSKARPREKMRARPRRCCGSCADASVPSRIGPRSALLLHRSSSSTPGWTASSMPMALLD